MGDINGGGNRETAALLQKISRAFRVPGPFFGYEEIKVGNVNRTYRVMHVAEDGSGAAHLKNYLVQKINTYAFRAPEQVMANIAGVTEHLKKKAPDEIFLQFYRTADGKKLCGG